MIVSLSPCPRDVGSVLSFPTRRSSDLEGVAVVYANLGDVTRVVADRHRAANERCQSWREVAPALEVDAVTLHGAVLGHRQQQSVEFIEGFGHAWQPPVTDPRLLRARPDLPVGPLVVGGDETGDRLIERR